MPHDTLFITDLHGNIRALQRAVDLARQSTTIQNLILGGDIAPNLVAVQLHDGLYVVRHQQRYAPEVADDFRARLRARNCYRAEDHHGKCVLIHAIDLDAKDFLEFGDLEVQTLLEEPSSFEFLCARQKSFVANELLPLLRRYRSEGKVVFVMLGNDDFAGLEALLLNEEGLGTLTYIHNRICPLGEGQILGYSHVLSKPFRYRHWEQTEEQIRQALARLTAGRDTTSMILSIHMPPYGTNLDRLGINGQHAGSRAVRSLLEARPFAIGLFGHIHESHLVSGSRHDQINSTHLFNPGGYHDTDCCAIVFDASNPADGRGLW